MKYCRNCPSCGKLQTYTDVSNFKRAFKRNSKCSSCSQKGGKKSEETKLKIAEGNKGKKTSVETRIKMSLSSGGDGKTFLLHDKPWTGGGIRAWANKVKLRDDYICQHCHVDCIPEEAQAHHIVAKSLYPEHWDEIDNGQTLCTYCHVIEHYKKPNHISYHQMQINEIISPKTTTSST